MCYRVYLIAILILFTATGIAGEKRYRVEILVLTHLHHEAVPSDAESLRDFSSSLDFLGARSAEDEDDDEDGKDENSEDSRDDAVSPDTGSELLSGEDLPEEPWADVIAVEDMSDVMREAWRRLRLSAPFRPEQYLSWEQSADEPFPSLRIHDLEVLLIENSCTDLHEILAAEAMEDANEGEGEDEDRPVVFSDQGNILPGGAEENAVEEATEKPELPESTLFHRIDGTVMLRRSRFLHLDLDIELRQAVFDEQLLTSALIPGSESESDESESPPPASFLIHQLKQSRQVKSRRMEYFDSPVLGVLAWITPFETEDEAASLPD